MHAFLERYETVLGYVANFAIHTLELVGILIIVVGSVKSVISLVSKLIGKDDSNVIIGLGKTLAIALEFKMGAEIVKTVIVRDITELGVLAIVIALRAVLALLIHWEIKSERRDEEEKKSSHHQQSSTKAPADNEIQ